MFLAKVTGAVVATQKVESMTGYKLLIVEPYRLESEKRETLVTTGRTFVAVDTLGAGTGEFVLITQGSSARLTPETKSLPIDTVIVGIVDSVHVDEQCVFSQEETRNSSADSDQVAAGRSAVGRSGGKSSTVRESSPAQKNRSAKK